MSALSQDFKFKIENKANIRNIVDIHSSLYLALRDNSGVELDTSDCVDADLSLIQLIESARVYARTAGKSFRLATPVGGDVEAALRRAGFLEKASGEDRRFWFNEGVE